MLRFANDIAVVAESDQDLSKLLHGMDRILTKGYNININRAKTKVMVCGRKKI